MNGRGVINRRKVALGLVVASAAASAPAYAISGGILRARADRPNRAEIQLRLPSKAELTHNVPSVARRPRHVRVGQAAVRVETPDSARKEPGRLKP
jgi:hypothetical protein